MQILNEYVNVSILLGKSQISSSVSKKNKRRGPLACTDINASPADISFLILIRNKKGDSQNDGRQLTGTPLGGCGTDSRATSSQDKQIKGILIVH